MTRFFSLLRLIFFNKLKKKQTKDLGVSWVHESITKNSKLDNVRPVVPRGLKDNDPEVVLWMENYRYTDYMNFKTSVKFLVK